MLWATRRALQAIVRSKRSTGIYGLDVHPQPVQSLLQTYKTTLSILDSQVPASTVYRQSVESITRDRQEIITKYAGSAGTEGGEGAIEAIEQEIGLGQIEEVLRIAKDELSLVNKMAEWKAWEPLQTKPDQGQWEYFKVTASTTYDPS
ncbi:uncharacterized protein L969DRAFT_19809 [Mixia osmundae IAM 14324]|uniref:NADH dehydrogenase [ubiquinone] 1 alpha subcomplex subunit 5 n=1 Tax=Mixia osmundae (strain CBS 9802 / IAM 14324 / JCM 22182 / KY 12970) TaxID=764103 RepID=G7E275_MIXOS|nr:uncharacterized protein L969DRAFT_19809 [Mixia osmundae IAM 14324]KEI36807.1 hypothetical protein L969DRAFT_19809 [Mixia osmundae IAM 14324]GAA96935.1 hypothetical protein E5Q_03609 [Mixia osmundae IAM 14324]